MRKPPTDPDILPAPRNSVGIQMYGHQPPITKTIQVRRTRHAGHCPRRRDELIIYMCVCVCVCVCVRGCTQRISNERELKLHQKL